MVAHGLLMEAHGSVCIRRIPGGNIFRHSRHLSPACLPLWLA